VARLKAWDTNKKRYELKQLYRAPFAYNQKEGHENGEDPHALCTNCYHHYFKSILQSSGHIVVHDLTWECPECKMKAKSQWRDMADWIKKTRNHGV